MITSVGPHNPLSRIGDWEYLPTPSKETRVRKMAYADGWVYQICSARGAQFDSEALKVLPKGSVWMDAWCPFTTEMSNEDDTVYVSFWLPEKGEA